jgi:hypothetical protein
MWRSCRTLQYCLISLKYSQKAVDGRNKSGIAINISKSVEGISVLQIQAMQRVYQLISEPLWISCLGRCCLKLAAVAGDKSGSQRKMERPPLEAVTLATVSKDVTVDTGMCVIVNCSHEESVSKILQLDLCTIISPCLVNSFHFEDVGRK